MSALVFALLFLCVEPGSGLKQSCWPMCSGDDCITLNRARLDFDSAEESCRRSSGRLLTLQSETHQQILKMLHGLPGNFWIGLRFPAGSCSNLSEPLRGYKWTSGGTNRKFNSSLIIWADSRKVCSPRCVSLSRRQTWTERPCSDQADGFLCRTTEKRACWEREVFFRSSATCASAPCEQTCVDAAGGFKCSCPEGFIPDSRDRRRCRLHCPQQRCPAVCQRGSCYCADGFVRNGGMCEDLNECEMGYCKQGCVNTFGSFACFCDAGFVLKDELSCVAAAGPADAELRVPTNKNTTLRGSAATTGAFPWTWVVAAGALVASVFLIRLYVVRRQKRRERSSNQRPAAPAEHPQS